MQSKLGRRVKAYREKAEISRSELAERTGLKESFIEELEEREAYPSLMPLLKVSRALGVRLGTFLDDLECADPCITRASERQPELVMHTGGGGKPALRFHPLAKGKSDRHMEPFFIELFPEEGGKEMTSHQGEEFIVVMSGEVELIHGKETHVLGPGDSLYFNSIVPHSVHAAGPDKAEIYAVLYFPE
ncbi:helix-turn-helix domain-containing protein [Desulfohalovibrio reitneri]|uniref:helix-turn-helix domain-containing protein n=1 Tax=Desulfohalovibrio reitneri TaxID=1307759 RepID=UPI0004A6FF7D|nr:cupin domain-containing protein [Desulfohalovibrio reitneri]